MRDKTTAHALYTKMESDRSPFLNRAKNMSELTLPHLFPRSESTATIDFPAPYQSLGARGVNNLANKIILSLFPPGTAFFKLGMNPMTKKQSGVSDGDFDKAILSVEKSIINEMEVSQLRTVLVDILKQTSVGGSAVLYVPVEGQPKSFSLGQFVVKRSKSGTVIKMILKESISIFDIPEASRESLVDLEDKELSGEKDLILYTRIERQVGGMYSVEQEVKGQVLKETQGTFNEKELPYIFIPFVDRREDYGRSYCEDLYGDLQSYEGLRKSILEASAESARLLYLLKPNSVLTPKNLETARSGDVVMGNPDDVSTLQADKRMDLSVAQHESDILRTDLATMFLLDSAVRRNAERVTAEEIRRVSQELEIALGGTYSTMANVLQEPLVRLYLKRLSKKGVIADVLKDNLQLEITTGSAALGRGTEFRNIQTYVSTVIELLGEQAYNYLNIPEALNRIAYSLDINNADLIKTQEQLQAEQAAAQQAEMQKNAVAPAINAASQQELNKNNS